MPGDWPRKGSEGLRQTTQERRRVSLAADAPTLSALERRNTMAKEDVTAVLKKAVVDDAFRLALSKDFDKAISAHDLSLTAPEREALRKIKWKEYFLAHEVAADWVHIYKT